MFSPLKMSRTSIMLCICYLFLGTSLIFAQSSNVPHTRYSTTEKLGDIALIAVPVSTLAATFIIGDKEGSWQFTKGLLLTAGVTYGLKWSVNKQRPDRSNENSFPSGHTSAVFHSAGFVHRRYGFKYAIPSYLLAGFTAATRIDANKHDIMDILAGATIGLGSNLIFTTEYQQEHMELTYTSENGNHMIGFKYVF